MRRGGRGGQILVARRPCRSWALAFHKTLTASPSSSPSLYLPPPKFIYSLRPHTNMQRGVRDDAGGMLPWLEEIIPFDVSYNTCQYILSECQLRRSKEGLRLEESTTCTLRLLLLRAETMRDNKHFRIAPQFFRRLSPPCPAVPSSIIRTLLYHCRSSMLISRARLLAFGCPFP